MVKLEIAYLKDLPNAEVFFAGKNDVYLEVVYDGFTYIP